jgi:hypothetical protein
MGFLSAYDGTHRVPIPHDNPDDPTEYWVDLKKHLTFGNTEKAQVALQEMELVNGTPRPAPNVFKQKAEKVLAAIVTWNLTDRNDTLLPVNMQSLRSLPEHVVELLHAEVEKSSGPRSKEEQAQFPAADRGGDQVAGGGVDAAGAVDVPGAEPVLEAPWPAS